MTHIIGKVYEVNKENMNKLIDELDETKASLKIAVEALKKIEEQDRMIYAKIAGDCLDELGEL